MPYIDTDRRALLSMVPNLYPEEFQPGDLAYLLFKLGKYKSAETAFEVGKNYLHDYMSANDIRFQTFAEMLGAIRSARTELILDGLNHEPMDKLDRYLIRQFVTPYEAKKKIENGEV